MDNGNQPRDAVQLNYITNDDEMDWKLTLPRSPGRHIATIVTPPHHGSSVRKK